MRSILLFLLALLGAGEALLAGATGAQAPCNVILSACRRAGYVEGGAPSGKGLWNDCVVPIMQGKRPANAPSDFAAIAPATIRACHEARPKFGMASGPAAASSQTMVFSVSPNQTLDYPKGQFLALPDEHQTFIPKREGSSDPLGSWVIAAMLHRVHGTNYGWTFLLETEDLLHLRLVPGAGDPAHGGAIFWPAHGLQSGAAGCNYTGVTHFDEQYAAPGSVLWDPTQGSQIMIYEAEIHCPYSKGGGGTGWISVGIAHSVKRVDAQGRARFIWPQPVAAHGYEGNWLDYGNGRYAGLTIPGVPQTTGEFQGFYGNALPSAFIDDVKPSGEKYLYVLYSFSGSPARRGDGKVHVARAKLGAPKLQFKKWYKGGWNAPGVQTTLPAMQDDGLEPAGCDALPSADSHAQITYNEALGLYMLTYTCTRLDCSTKPCKRTSMSWFYRTTRDLGTQNWSDPQLIENSTYPIPNTTGKDGNTHYFLNGGYPTFMTPGCEPGHIGLTGYVFLLDGDPLGQRVFARRKFVINAGGAPVHEACGVPQPRE